MKDYLLHGIYFLFYGIVKYFPSPIGDAFRYIITKPFIKHMGKVRIYEGTTFWYPYNVSIGSNVTINENVYINGYGTIQIGDAVRIGSRTMVLSSDHVFDDLDKEIYKQGLRKLPVNISDDVFIGANVLILGGVSIGTHSVIGAGSIVTKDVPPHCVVAGNPARVIKYLDETDAET